MAASFPQYSEQYILDLVNVRITFDKGMNYFLENRVHDLSWSEDYSSFCSTVSGTYDYSCTLNFKGNNLISHYCDCSAHSKYTGPCKHIVATMLAISAERERQANKKVRPFTSFPQYSEQYILDLLNVRITFDKGMNYFWENRVHNLRWNEDYSSFYSTVSGTYDYSCTLNFRGNNLISHSCNCPAHYKYTGPCKHIVATMLAISAERERRANKEEHPIAFAEQGDPVAQTLLGWNYQSGNGVEQSYEEAVKWFRKAAEQGDSAAQYSLGISYYYGWGLAQSYGEAVKWFRKAAEQGDNVAQFILGDCYYNGQGVTQSYVEAAKWYGKAAKQGNANARSMFEECKKALNEDIDRAALSHTEPKDAESLYMLGVRYYNGQGVTQSYEEAAKWYSKAAEQGHTYAQTALAGCEKILNKEKERAASSHTELKDAESLNALGIRYYKGNGVAQSYEEAAKYFRKAVEQGLAVAQNSLGWCYYEGKGVGRSYIEAVKWFRKAAEQGLAVAQSNLGVCYEDGKGVTQSYKEAARWYSKAAEQGNEYAKTALDRCLKHISKDNSNGKTADYIPTVQGKKTASSSEQTAYIIIFCVLPALFLLAQFIVLVAYGIAQPGLGISALCCFFTIVLSCIGIGACSRYKDLENISKTDLAILIASVVILLISYFISCV